MQKVIITGVTGFLGSYLFKKLKKNFNVTGFSRKKNYNFSFVKKYSDIHKENAFLIYLSEESNITTFNKFSNFRIKENQKILEVLSRKFGKKLIYASSSKIYSDKNRRQLKETDSADPKNKYEKNKINCEKIVLKNNGIVLRISNIYGDKIKKESVFLKIIRQINNKSPYLYLNSTHHIRDFLYIEDLLELFKKIISNPKTGIFNVGSGKGISILSLLKLISKIFNKNKKIIVKDKYIKFSCQILNIDRVYRTFKWKPRFSIYKKLEQVIKYYG